MKLDNVMSPPVAPTDRLDQRRDLETQTSLARPDQASRASPLDNTPSQTLTENSNASEQGVTSARKRQPAHEAGHHPSSMPKEASPVHKLPSRTLPSGMLGEVLRVIQASARHWQWVSLIMGFLQRSMVGKPDKSSMNHSKPLILHLLIQNKHPEKTQGPNAVLSTRAYANKARVTRKAQTTRSRHGGETILLEMQAEQGLGLVTTGLAGDLPLLLPVTDELVGADSLPCLTFPA